jgi:hypothetical protein
MRRIVSLSLLLLTVLPLAAAAAGSDGSALDPATISLTFTVGDGGGAPRVLHLRALDGRNTRLQTGWRLPIPTSAVAAATAGGPPLTSFQYQDVGMRVSVECHVIGSDRIQLAGELEISGEGATRALRQAASSPPALRTLNHRFDVAVPVGTDTVLARIPDPEGGEMSLTVRASIGG